MDTSYILNKRSSPNDICRKNMTMYTATLMDIVNSPRNTHASFNLLNLHINSDIWSSMNQFV